MYCSRTELESRIVYNTKIMDLIEIILIHILIKVLIRNHKYNSQENTLFVKKINVCFIKT